MNYIGSERVGNKVFSWDFRNGHEVLVYADGSKGPSVCFTMDRSRTGAIKMKFLGNWKFTLDQHEWINRKAFSLFKEYDNGDTL